MINEVKAYFEVHEKCEVHWHWDEDEIIIDLVLWEGADVTQKVDLGMIKDDIESEWPEEEKPTHWLRRVK